MSNTSRTNWAKIDAMTDDDIDMSDIPPLTEEFLPGQIYGCRKQALN
jgi:hypothetical protein